MLQKMWKTHVVSHSGNHLHSCWGSHIELLAQGEVCSLTNVLISWGLTHKYADIMGFDRHKC